jgi:hypothetical protein
LKPLKLISFFDFSFSLSPFFFFFFWYSEEKAGTLRKLKRLSSLEARMKISWKYFQAIELNIGKILPQNTLLPLNWIFYKSG